MDAVLRKSRTRLIYNHIAPLYARLRLVFRKKDVPTVLQLLEINDRDRVLDAGMGPGIYTFEILRRTNPADVIGIDLCERFVSIARERARKMNAMKASFHIADLENLPFTDSEFDKIICSGVLLIIPDQMKALYELRRVLKPGGRIVFVEPLDEIFFGKEVFYIFARLFLRMMALSKPELRCIQRSDFAGRYFSENGLYSLLDKIGFQRVEVRRNRVEVYGICDK